MFIISESSGESMTQFADEKKRQQAIELAQGHPEPMRRRLLQLLILEKGIFSMSPATCWEDLNSLQLKDNSFFE